MEDEDLELIMPTGHPGPDLLDKQVNYKQKLEEKVHKTEEKLEKEEKLRKNIEEKQLRTLQEKNDLLTQLEAEKGHVGEMSDKLTKVSAQKQELENQLVVRTKLHASNSSFLISREILW